MSCTFIEYTNEWEDALQVCNVSKLRKLYRSDPLFFHKMSHPCMSIMSICILSDASEETKLECIEWLYSRYLEYLKLNRLLGIVEYSDPYFTGDELEHANNQKNEKIRSFLSMTKLLNVFTKAVSENRQFEKASNVHT